MISEALFQTTWFYAVSCSYLDVCSNEPHHTFPGRVPHKSGAHLILMAAVV